MADNWLHVAPSSGGSGTTNVNITADTNSTNSQRTAIIYFKAGKIKKTVRVVQGAAAGTITVSITPAQATLDYNTTVVTLTATISGSYEGTPSYSWSFSNLPSEVVASSTGSSACTLNYTGDVTSTKSFTATCTVTAGSVSGSGTGSITVEPKSSGQLTVSIMPASATLNAEHVSQVFTATTNSSESVRYVWTADNTTIISIVSGGTSNHELLTVTKMQNVATDTPINIYVTATTASQTATTTATVTVQQTGALSVEIACDDSLILRHAENDPILDGDTIQLTAITYNSFGTVTCQWEEVGSNYLNIYPNDTDNTADVTYWTYVPNDNTPITIRVSASTPTQAVVTNTITVTAKTAVIVDVFKITSPSPALLSWDSGETTVKEIWGYGSAGAEMVISQDSEHFTYLGESSDGEGRQYTTLTGGTTPQLLFRIQPNETNTSGKPISWDIRIEPRNQAAHQDMMKNVMACHYSSASDNTNMIFFINKNTWGFNEGGSSSQTIISASTREDFWGVEITGVTASSSSFTAEIISHSQGISPYTAATPTTVIRIYPNDKNLTTSDNVITLTYGAIYKETTEDENYRTFSGTVATFTQVGYGSGDTDISLSATTQQWEWSGTSTLNVSALTYNAIPVQIVSISSNNTTDFTLATEGITQLTSSSYVNLFSITPTGRNQSDVNKSVTVTVTISTQFGNKSHSIEFIQSTTNDINITDIWYDYYDDTPIPDHIAWEWNEVYNGIGNNVAQLKIMTEPPFRKPNAVTNTIPNKVWSEHFSWVVSPDSSGNRYAYTWPIGYNDTVQTDGAGTIEIPLTGYTTVSYANGATAQTYIIQDRPRYAGAIKGIDSVGSNWSTTWNPNSNGYPQGINNAIIVKVDDSCITGGTTAITNDSWSAFELRWGNSAGTQITSSEVALPYNSAGNYNIWAKPQAVYDTTDAREWTISGKCSTIYATSNSLGQKRVVNFPEYVTLRIEKFNDPYLVLYLGSGISLKENTPGLYLSISSDTIVNGIDEIEEHPNYNVKFSYDLTTNDTYLSLTQTNGGDTPIRITAITDDLNSSFVGLTIIKDSDGNELDYSAITTAMTFNAVLYSGGTEYSPTYYGNDGMRTKWNSDHIVHVVGKLPVSNVTITSTPQWAYNFSNNRSERNLQFIAPEGTYQYDGDTRYFDGNNCVVSGDNEGTMTLFLNTSSPNPNQFAHCELVSISKIGESNVSADTVLIHLPTTNVNTNIRRHFLVSGYDKRIYISSADTNSIISCENLYEDNLMLWPYNYSVSGSVNYYIDGTNTTGSARFMGNANGLHGDETTYTAATLTGVVYMELATILQETLPEGAIITGISGTSAVYSDDSQVIVNADIAYTRYGLLGWLDDPNNNNNGNGDGDEGGGSTGEDTGGQT